MKLDDASDSVDGLSPSYTQIDGSDNVAKVLSDVRSYLLALFAVWVAHPFAMIVLSF